MRTSPLYMVKWEPGQFTCHAASEKEAVEIALEYLRAKDLIRGQVVQPQTVQNG